MKEKKSNGKIKRKMKKRKMKKRKKKDKTVNKERKRNKKKEKLKKKRTYLKAKQTQSNSIFYHEMCVEMEWLIGRMDKENTHTHTRKKTLQKIKKDKMLLDSRVAMIDSLYPPMF